ncbi:MAG: ROK family protein [Fimbriimonadaceae bacterium]|jgi:glucokinase|nr:ROK family protein [Fimbriimonadaceae bacterium]
MVRLGGTDFLNQPSFGFDLGGTGIKAVVLGLNNEVVHRESITFSEDRWEEPVRDTFEKLVESHGHPSAVGVACPGIAHPSGDSTWWMEGRQANVQGFDWARHFSLAFRVPVLNDAQSALVAEWLVGAGKGSSNVLLLTLGTGVGGAVVSDGRLLKGHLGRAGHVGHISLDGYGKPDLVGTPGSLENEIGDASLAERSRGMFTTTQDLIQACQAGNEEAKSVWQRSVHLLAVGITGLINVFDPELILLGGGISQAGELLFDPLREHLSSLEWRPHGCTVTLKPAQLGSYSGAIGAALNAQGLK